MPAKALLFALPKLDGKSTSAVCRIEHLLNRIRWSKDIDPPAIAKGWLDHIFEDIPSALHTDTEGDLEHYTLRTPLASVGSIPAVLYWFERTHQRIDPATNMHVVDAYQLSLLLANIKTVLAARLPFLSHDLLPVRKTVVNTVAVYGADYYDSLAVARDMLEDVFRDGRLLDFDLLYTSDWAETPAPSENAEPREEV